MKKDRVKEQHEYQLSYFGKEFSQVDSYVLEPWQQTYIKRIREYLLGRDHKNKTLIDIGTGRGYVAVEMAKLGVNVIACDLTKESLSNIAKYKKQFKLNNIKLIQCKAEKIPLKNNSIDFVIANAVLEHIPEESKAITEWKRILKRGGKMFVTVPLKYQYNWPFLIPINYFYDKKIGHLRRYTKEDLERKFNMKAVAYMYTGHLIKFIGSLVFTVILRTHILEPILEELDQREAKHKYGATNVIVVFKK